MFIVIPYTLPHAPHAHPHTQHVEQKQQKVETKKKEIEEKRKAAAKLKDMKEAARRKQLEYKGLISPSEDVYMHTHCSSYTLFNAHFV